MVAEPFDKSKPLSPTGGVVGLQGSLAPDGAIVKVAGMENLKFSGPARCLNCEDDAFAAVEGGNYAAGDVIVIRYEGPKGGPGMREMLSTTAAIYGQGNGDIITIDAESGRIDLEVGEEMLSERAKKWRPPESQYTSGVLWKYADQVGPARKGAVTHPGGKAEKQCYADI